MSNEIRQDRIARYVALIEKPDEFLDLIVQRMTSGDMGYEGLPAICRALDVPYGKVMGWLMADAERYGLYDRALAVQAKALVSEAVEIADAGDDVARDKLRVDTRFRLAKYHDSKVYGDKVDVNHNVVPVFMVTIAAEGGHVIDVPSEVVSEAQVIEQSVSHEPLQDTQHESPL